MRRPPATPAVSAMRIRERRRSVQARGRRGGLGRGGERGDAPIVPSLLPFLAQEICLVHPKVIFGAGYVTLEPSFSQQEGEALLLPAQLWPDPAPPAAEQRPRESGPRSRTQSSWARIAHFAGWAQSGTSCSLQSYALLLGRNRERVVAALKEKIKPQTRAYPHRVAAPAGSEVGPARRAPWVPLRP